MWFKSVELLVFVLAIYTSIGELWNMVWFVSRILTKQSAKYTTGSTSIVAILWTIFYAIRG